MRCGACQAIYLPRRFGAGDAWCERRGGCGGCTDFGARSFNGLCSRFFGAGASCFGVSWFCSCFCFMTPPALRCKKSSAAFGTPATGMGADLRGVRNDDVA
jgi:hypothetical protein